MERVMADLAHKQEAPVGSVGISDMAAHRASCARVVGIHFDRHRSVQERFVSNHAVQFCKRPFGVGSIGPPLLLARLLAFLASGSLPNVRLTPKNRSKWDMFKEAPARVGYDPAPIFESVDHPNFGALRQVPWSIELVNFPGAPLVWHLLSVIIKLRRISSIQQKCLESHL